MRIPERDNNKSGSGQVVSSAAGLSDFRWQLLTLTAVGKLDQHIQIKSCITKYSLRDKHANIVPLESLILLWYNLGS